MNTVKNIILLALGLIVSVAAFSQKKIGHINSQELYAIMPEADSAQKKLEAIAKDHELTIEELQVEYNKALDEYKTNAATYTDLKKAMKEEDLEVLARKIQNFTQIAEQDIQQKRMELFQPIQEKAINAVNEVAADNNFTYIFDLGMGAIVYTGDDAIDIMPLVKEKLGLE